MLSDTSIAQWLRDVLRLVRGNGTSPLATRQRFALAVVAALELDECDDVSDLPAPIATLIAPDSDLYLPLGQGVKGGAIRRLALDLGFPPTSTFTNYTSLQRIDSGSRAFLRLIHAPASSSDPVPSVLCVLHRLRHLYIRATAVSHPTTCPDEAAAPAQAAYNSPLTLHRDADHSTSAPVRAHTISTRAGTIPDSIRFSIRPISGEGDRCCYRAIAGALGVERNELVDVLRTTVNSIDCAATLCSYGLDVMPDANSDAVLAAKLAYTSTLQFNEMRMGGSVEMYLLSHARGGTLSFLTVDNTAEPIKRFCANPTTPLLGLVRRGNTAAPTSLMATSDGEVHTEVTLHHCTYTGLAGPPGHYNRFEYSHVDNEGETVSLKMWPYSRVETPAQRTSRHSSLIKLAAMDTERARRLTQREQEVALNQILVNEHAAAAAAAAARTLSPAPVVAPRPRGSGSKPARAVKFTTQCPNPRRASSRTCNHPHITAAPDTSTGPAVIDGEPGTATTLSPPSLHTHRRNSSRVAIAALTRTANRQVTKSHSVPATPSSTSARKTGARRGGTSTAVRDTNSQARLRVDVTSSIEHDAISTAPAWAQYRVKAWGEIPSSSRGHFLTIALPMFETYHKFSSIGDYSKCAEVMHLILDLPTQALVKGSAVQLNQSLEAHMTVATRILQRLTQSDVPHTGADGAPHGGNATSTANPIPLPSSNPIGLDVSGDDRTDMVLSLSPHLDSDASADECNSPRRDEPLAPLSLSLPLSVSGDAQCHASTQSTSESGSSSSSSDSDVSVSADSDDDDDDGDACHDDDDSDVSTSDTEDSPSPSPLDPSHEESDPITRAIKRATHTVRAGGPRSLSRAARALLQAPLAPITPDVIEKLRLLHPTATEVMAPLPHNRAVDLIAVDEVKLFRLIKVVNNGSAPGPSGWSGSHLKLISECESEEAKSGLTLMVKDIANGVFGGATQQRLLASVLIPVTYLDKPGKVRPIAMGEVFVKLASHYVMSLIEADIPALFPTIQYGVKRPGGSEAAAQMTRAMLNHSGTLHADTIALKTDFENAFNAMSRSHVWNTLLDHPRTEPIWKMFRWAYATPSPLLVHDRNRLHTLLRSSEGVRQGDVFSAFGFGLGVQPLYVSVLAGSPECNAVSVLDDLTLVGPCDQVMAAYDKLKDTAAQYHLKLRVDKCAVYIPPSVDAHPALQSSIRAACTTRGLAHAASIESLGVMFGSDADVRDHGERTLDSHTQFFACLRHPAMDVQIGFALLRFCGVPRLSYLARTVRPEQFHPTAVRFDEMVNATFDSMMGIGAPERTSQSPDITADSLRTHIAFPLRDGGMGIRPVLRASQPAYFASLVSVMPDFVRMYPTCADVTHTQLHRELEACRVELVSMGAGTAPTCTPPPTLHPIRVKRGVGVPRPVSDGDDDSDSDDDENNNSDSDGDVPLPPPTRARTTRTRKVSSTPKRKRATTTVSPAARPASNTHTSYLKSPGTHRQKLANGRAADASATAAAAAATDGPDGDHRHTGAKAKVATVTPSPIPAALQYSLTELWTNARSESSSASGSQGASDDRPQQLQRILTHNIEKFELRKFIASSPRYRQAILIALSAPHASDYLTLLPTQPRYRMSNEGMRLAVRHRLGLLPFNSLTKQCCPCRFHTAFTADPDHFHSCDRHKRTLLSQRHGNIMQVVMDLARACGFVAIQEPNGHIRTEDVRDLPATSVKYNIHGDILLLKHDLKLYIDVSVTRPTTPSQLQHPGTTRTPLFSTRKVESLKHGKYDAICVANGYEMFPFVMESYGGVAPQAVRLLHTLAAHSREHSRSEFLTHAYRRLSVVMQLANANIQLEGMHQMQLILHTAKGFERHRSFAYSAPRDADRLAKANYLQQVDDRAHAAVLAHDDLDAVATTTAVGAPSRVAFDHSTRCASADIDEESRVTLHHRRVAAQLHPSRHAHFHTHTDMHHVDTAHAAASLITMSGVSGTAAA